MQTEEQKSEAPAEKPPEKPEKPERSRKEELLMKQSLSKRRGDKLTKAEQKELEAILEEEKLEHERGAIIHKLTESALKYQRKESGKIKREVTDRVREFSGQESAELAQVRKAIKEERKTAQKAVDEAIAALQKDLKAALSALDKKEAEETAEVQAKYRSQYDDAAAQIEHDVTNVETTIRLFKDDVQNLTLDQLRTLQKDGVVEVGKVKGQPDYLVAPGTDKS